MKKLQLILSSMMTLFAISTAMAQHHDMWEIIPASKGSLPTYQELAKPAEGRFPGLRLDRVEYSHHNGFIVNGNWMNLDAYEPWLSVDYPETFGGEYYTLQYRTKSSGVWKTDTDEDGKAVQHSGPIAALTPKITEDTDYRIQIHGGPMDGYLSNEVSAKMPTVNYSVITRQHISQPNFITPGVKVEGAMIEAERQDKGHLEGNLAKYNKLASFKYDSPCYSHQWYRRNPNTLDMEAIAGATDIDYTPTAEDVGFELVDVTTGDDVNISFYVASSHGIVSVAIGASIDYIGDDGFVLNTDYDIPNAEQKIILYRYDEEAGTDIQEPFGNALEKRKPGQYVIKMNKDLYKYGQLSYADEGYYLSFVYKSPIYDDNNNVTGYEPWYHYPMIEPESFYRTLQIKPLLNGEPLATSVDILGKNTEGKLVTVKTLTAEDLTDGVMTTDVYKGKYYVKAHQTEGTMDTYYPDVLTWSDAGIVEPEAVNWEIEDWQPTCATINIAGVLAPLQGSSVIEGTITINASANRTRGADDNICTVYLKDQSADKIIAQTQTDASGHYKFENVPVGDYLIIPNVDGFKTATPVDIQVTQPHQTIANADCALIKASEAEIFHESTVLPGDAFEDGTVDMKDVAAIADFLMGKNPDNFNKNNADFNGDGHVNAADIVSILNIINANKPAVLTKADLIGTWEVKAQEESGENSFSYSFTEDNLTVEQQGAVQFTAPYTFEDGILTYTVPATEWSEAYTETRNVSMLYDKTVLVLKYQETIEMMDENMEPVETTVDQAEVYINKVKQPDTSGAKLDGKWFCYHRGDEAEVRSGLWIDGDKAEFVIGAWATRMVGTYTYSNGILTLKPTAYYSGRGEGGWGYGRIDPATLECSQWDPIENPDYPETFVFILNGNEAYSWYANLPCVYYKQ